MGCSLAAVNGERRKPVLARFDARAHLRQRLHDAIHRPARQRFVAADAGHKRLRGQNAGKHPNGRAGIARVQRGGGLAQSFQAAAVDMQTTPSLVLTRCAERPHAAQRGLAVGAARIVRDLRWRLRRSPPASHSGGKWICRREAGSRR